MRCWFRCLLFPIPLRVEVRIPEVLDALRIKMSINDLKGGVAGGSISILGGLAAQLSRAVCKIVGNTRHAKLHRHGWCAELGP